MPKEHITILRIASQGTSFLSACTLQTEGKFWNQHRHDIHESTIPHANAHFREPCFPDYCCSHLLPKESSIGSARNATGFEPVSLLLRAVLYHIRPIHLLHLVTDYRKQTPTIIKRPAMMLTVCYCSHLSTYIRIQPNIVAPTDSNRISSFQTGAFPRKLKSGLGHFRWIHW